MLLQHCNIGCGNDPRILYLSPMVGQFGHPFSLATNAPRQTKMWSVTFAFPGHVELSHS
jgi:hypothetical protein